MYKIPVEEAANVSYDRYKLEERSDIIMTHTMKQKRFAVLAACTVLLLILLMGLLYRTYRQPLSAGNKTISVTVVYQDASTDDYTVTTQADCLENALNSIPELTLDGTTTREFGLMINTVNGIRADYQLDGAYWSLFCDDILCNYGVSQQPIKDGEHYRIVYTLAQ